MPTPEDRARENIDQALEQAGWKVQDYKSANLQAGRGMALRNFPLVRGHGFADYLLYVDGKAAGVVAAKKEGFPLVGVEIQAVKYSEGLPPTLPAYLRPLPFLYQSTGIETRFINGLDLDRHGGKRYRESFLDWSIGGSGRLIHPSGTLVRKPLSVRVRLKRRAVVTDLWEGRGERHYRHARADANRFRGRYNISSRETAMLLIEYCLMRCSQPMVHGPSLVFRFKVRDRGGKERPCLLLALKVAGPNSEFLRRISALLF